MRNNVAIILISSILFSNYCFSQIQSAVVAKEVNIAKVSFENLVYMLNQSSLAWENEIKAIGFGYREIHDGGIQYSSGNTMAGGIQMVQKAPDFLSVMWIHSTSDVTIMDGLQNSLEKNFLGRDGKYLVYGINFMGQNYTIHLVREQYSEMLFIRKQKK